MEIEKIINGLKTVKDKIELEFIADEIREAYHAGYIKACRKRLEK